MSSTKETKEYRKGYYQDNKKRWKEKYAANSEQLDAKKEYLREYYKKNKEKWKNEDGTWKDTRNGKCSSKEYYRRKVLRRRKLNRQQKRFKKSLDQGADMERAIVLAYPKCNTPGKIDERLHKLNQNNYLAITIEDYHKLHSDVGLTPFKSAVKRNIIVDKVTEKSDPKTDGNAIRTMEWMDRMGRKVDPETNVGVNIAIFQYSDEKRLDMERIIEKEKARRGENKEDIKQKST